MRATPRGATAPGSAQTACRRTAATRPSAGAARRGSPPDAARRRPARPPRHVLFQVARHHLGQADVRQVAERVPAGKGLARAGHHRHAHPQGVAGGQAAGERKRVQGQVDLLVLGQGIVVGRPARERQTIAADPLGGEQLHVSALDGAGRPGRGTSASAATAARAAGSRPRRRPLRG